MPSFGTGDPAKTNRMQEINTLIWSMSIIYFEAKRTDYTRFAWPDMPLRAKECALYYCIKTIESKVDDNVIHDYCCIMEYKPLRLLKYRCRQRFV